MADANPQRPAPPLLDDGCALFLDVDGTLIGFEADPAAVRLLPQVREAVGAISDRLGGAVALVSGRPVAQLDLLFAPLRLPAAGLHGHQFRADASAAADIPVDTSAFLHELHHQATHLAAAYPGVLVEHKGASLALHWRAAPQYSDVVTGFARQRIGALSGYRLQPGDHVVEFVPDGADKGRALERMMARAPFAGRVPVFVGDDLTDESGFAAAHRAGGWSVLVGAREPSAATHGLADIHEVHAWLQANATRGQTLAR